MTTVKIDSSVKVMKHMLYGPEDILTFTDAKTHISPLIPFHSFGVTHFAWHPFLSATLGESFWSCMIAENCMETVKSCTMSGRRHWPIRTPPSHAIGRGLRRRTSWVGSVCRSVCSNVSLY